MAPGGPGAPHNGPTRVTEVVTWLLKNAAPGLVGPAALIGPFGIRSPGSESIRV